MISHASSALQPVQASVLRCENDAARSGNYRMRLVAHVKTIERCVRRRRLRLPMKTAVVRVQDRTVIADGPAVSLVFRKANGIDQIALRPRVLPFPTRLQGELRID